jgi:two-component system, LytTR family, response regulator
MDTTKPFGLIALPSIHEYILTPPQDIVYCSSEGNYSVVHLADGHKVTICKKLKALEQVLTGEFFIRVHNCYLINLLHATTFSKRDGWQIRLSNGRTIAISRSNHAKLMERIQTL